MKQKVTIMLQKKHFLVIFGFYVWKTHTGLHYKHKNVKFCMQNFFCKIYNLTQKQICSQKRD